MAKRGRPPKKQSSDNQRDKLNQLLANLDDKKLAKLLNILEEKDEQPKQIKTKPLKLNEDSPKIIGVPKNCIAPSRKSNNSDSQEGQQIEKDGKTYTVSRKIGWNSDNFSNNFKDNAKLVKRDLGLKYQEPIDRRDPAEQIECQCSSCGNKELLYPSQIPHVTGICRNEQPLYQCNDCIVRRKRGRY